MSNYIVSYTYAAVADISDAVTYYEAQLNGLGERFAKALLDKIDAVVENPFIARIRYDDVRCRTIETFPYMIHYTVVEEASEIIIDAVWHTSRKPL